MRKDDIVMMKKLTVGLLALCVALSVEAQNDIWRADSLQEVVVTGTGTQHLLKDAPVQTEVISHRQLQQYGGRSLEEILAGLTASFSFNEGDMGSQMQMNGLGNNYILVLIDGKRIHGDVGGENDLSLIDPHNIEKIEIVKGASSALYGSDAIAGVINIITRKHNEALLLENTTRMGSYGDVRQHNGIALGFGRWKSYTNFQLQHSDGWQNTATEDPRQTEYLITDSRNKTVNRHTNWQVSERLTFEPTKGLEFYADGSIYRKRIYRPSGIYPGVDVKTYDLRYNNASASLGGKWYFRGQRSEVRGERSEVRGDRDVITLDVDWNRHAYYYDFTAVTLTDGIYNGQPTAYFPYYPGQHQLQSDQQRIMAALKGIFTLPAGNKLSAGAEWRYDWLKAPNRVADGKASDNTRAVYLQDEWISTLWGDNGLLHLTGGLRLTDNEQSGFRLTPKLSAMLGFGDMRLRASWSQGFKTPTPKELFYHYVRDMNGTYLYLGNTSLKPQTSNYFSLSGEYSRKGFSLTVTAYYNKVDDMIALVTIPNSQVPGDLYAKYLPLKTRQYQNLESAKTKGIDVNVRYTIGQEWMAGAAYSYLDTDAKIYDTEEEKLTDVVIDGMARHKGSWFLTWNHSFSPSYRFSAGIYGRMSSKRYYQINGDGKGYQTWRLTTTHDLGSSKRMSYRVEAGIDNIFDYVDRTPHGLHLGTTTPGRTVYATLTVRFHKGKNLINKYKSNLNYKQDEQD